MAHRIIIMHDKGEQSGGTPAPRTIPDRHHEVLEAAASQMAVIGPRFFRAVKAMMVHNLELPEDVREMGETKMLVLHTLVKGEQLTSDLAKHFNVTNPTMTRIIDALVDKGYVERHHARGDREGTQEQFVVVVDFDVERVAVLKLDIEPSASLTRLELARSVDQILERAFPGVLANARAASRSPAPATRPTAGPVRPRTSRPPRSAGPQTSRPP